MNEEIWFSNYCPHFSVHDAALISRQNEKITMAPKVLREHGFYKAALWLERNPEAWLNHLRAAAQAIKMAERGEFKIILWGDPDFPPSLAHIAFPPSVLFVKGDVKRLQLKPVSIVGSRHPTDLGRLWVKDVVKDLVAHDITIVSGGARGIDAEAHFAALVAGGKTVAFLPGGIDKPYPVTNSYVFERIEKNGALVSEFLPGTAVRAENFFRRNRLIAGVSSVVVIVEAGLRSGTIMTARKARDENREVLVVPGPPKIASYAGSLELLAEGAGLARDAGDIIKSLIKEKF